MTTTTTGARRWLFTLTILAGSFLLFLVQPMVARMALPRLGGAPNVWNSAMLVYQALLLGGYAYAHFLGRLSLARQGLVHLGVLVLGGLTLPLALADIAPPTPGWETLWVPWLFLLTVGPAFFAISAQAPLIQRWFAAHPLAGNPYPLYAASNLGSFAGLLAYPLLAEPILPIGQQSWYWTVGYGVLIVLVMGVVWARRGMAADAASSREDVKTDAPAAEPRSDRRTVFLWLALSAVPSGLMLSTTTFLTTDIMAMPLLWVIPLGLYLLSFSIAFAERRALAGIFIFLAPVVLLVDGSLAMFAAGRADLLAAVASVIMLFVVAVALHARLYDSRPPASQLTRFYLVMSAGGALGGLFTALLAPVLFDWTWEHPLLILGAAALLPLAPWKAMLERLFSNAHYRRLALVAVIVLVFVLALQFFPSDTRESSLSWLRWTALAALLACALLLTARRWSFVTGIAALLLSLGGLANLQTSFEGLRERSYFGIYSIREAPNGDKLLMHGTTIHGVQRAGDAAEDLTTYYGPGSGVGRVLQQASELFGPNARIGVVGLGVGTLACYREEGQDWTFFEIDPEVLNFSQRGEFTYLSRCAPGSRVVIGDARLELEAVEPGRFDVLVIDAFSSDAIPLHLLTNEAIGIYLDALDEGGVVVLHISNNYIRLEPVVSRLAHERGLSAMQLSDQGAQDDEVYASSWVALSRDPKAIAQIAQQGNWRKLTDPEGTVWTDDYASILPYLIWENFL